MFKILYLQFVDGIDIDLLVKYSKKVVEDYIRNDKTKMAKKIHDPKQKENFLSGKYVLDDILQKSFRLELFQDIRKEMFKDISSDDLVYAFFSFFTSRIILKIMEMVPMREIR